MLTKYFINLIQIIFKKKFFLRITEMLGRGRKKTSSSYLRNGGFKIHHFDSKNI